MINLPQKPDVPRDSNGNRSVLLSDLYLYKKPACRYLQADGVTRHVFYAGDEDMPIVTPSLPPTE
jgi:predicted metal-binding protein